MWERSCWRVFAHDLIEHTAKHRTNNKCNNQSWVQHLGLLLWLDSPSQVIAMLIPNFWIAFQVTEDCHWEEVFLTFQFALFWNILAEYFDSFSLCCIWLMFQLFNLIFYLLHVPYFWHSFISISTAFTIYFMSTLIIDRIILGCNLGWWTSLERTLFQSFLLHLLIIVCNNFQLSPFHDFQLTVEKWELTDQRNHLHFYPKLGDCV